MLGRVFRDDDTVNENSPFELGCKVCYLSQLRNKEGFEKRREKIY